MPNPDRDIFQNNEFPVYFLYFLAPPYYTYTTTNNYTKNLQYVYSILQYKCNVVMRSEAHSHQQQQVKSECMYGIAVCLQQELLISCHEWKI